MKHWKKYLAAAGTALVVLALIIVINNNNKEKTPVEQSTTEVKANVQTGEDDSNTGEGDSNTIESSILLAPEVNSSEQDTVINEKQSVSEEDIESEIKKLINTYYEIPGKTDKENSNTADQTVENQTVDTQSEKEGQTVEQTSESQKSESGSKTSEIIEKYKNIKTYIKPGLDEDSYVVFTTYDIKLYKIDTLVPGMSSLSVTRDESGNLQINDASDDAKLKEHIVKLSKEKDIKKIIKEVNSKLTAAVKKDNSLKGLIDYLK